MRTLCFSRTVATVLVVATTFAVPCAHAQSSHPVLEALAPGLELRPDLYLVRSVRPLPDLPGVEVVAYEGASRLISAPEESRRELVLHGFNPVPLLPVAEAPVPKTWPTVTTPDPRIEAMVAAVDWTNLRAKINKLQNFDTRFFISPQGLTVADTLVAFFERKGIEVEIDPFVHGEFTHRNVVATQRGTKYPDQIVLVGAHFDSISEIPLEEAPGADDNASGTALVQYVAQTLAAHSFEYTIQYVLFAAEEAGLVGSRHFAAQARAEGLDIVAMLNFDMVGYWRRGLEFDLEIESNQASVWLMDAVTNAADLYTTMPYETHVYDAAYWGDHASFWGEGYAALNHEEAFDWADPDFNPSYHTSVDRLTGIDEDFMVGNTQLAIAATATLARMVDAVSTEEPRVGAWKARFRGQ